NVLIIESESGFSCKIAGTDASSFPGFPEIKSEQESTIPAEKLKTMIAKSIFAVAKDDSRAVLCGCLLEIEPKKISMVTTDGHRLGCCWYPIEMGVEEKISVIVYPKSLLNLVASLNAGDDAITMTVSEKYVVFTTNHFVLYTKRIEGAYPDYEKVIPKNNFKKAVVEKEMLVNAVRRVSILSNQKTHLVKFVFKVGELEIAVLNRDIGGEAREIIPADYKEEDFSIGFNALYFCEIINIVDTPKVRLEMNTQISACLIYPEYDKKDKNESRSNEVLLIMPLRIMEDAG
ncbi:MAG: DNA polymerase III subunit beta, partial [Chitinivibrionales bacterium]|nr:DNA polymerase III subunit beta [Chitinivibrionales bacterium]